ncbi:hypothetical protein [Anabaena sp. CCY 0017]|uniref:hypothetical protein n=1 Tax=Anabaena sp. CCY 0017 TaxID=3103866 RepID=UPI0039C6C35F
MLSKDSETPFGTILWEIVRDPQIPEEKPQESEITPEKYQESRERWNQTIASKNNLRSHAKRRTGLSLEDFIKMIVDLYGYDYINKPSLHRLICTANPKIGHHSKSVHEENLAFIARFSREYSYEQLLNIGLQTVHDYLGSIPSDFQSHTPLYYPATTVEIKLDKNGYIPSEKPTNIRSLVHQFLVNNGYRPLVDKGIPPEDILKLLFDKQPKILINTLPLLRDMLSIPADDFLRMCKDLCDLN